jgi:hypothetical protein
MNNVQREKALRKLYQYEKLKKVILNVAIVISIIFMLSVGAIVIYKIISLYILPLFS